MTTLVRDAAQQGVTKLRTRRQRRIRGVAVLVALIGAVACLAAGSVIAALIRDGQLTWPHLEVRSPRVEGAGAIIDPKNPDAGGQGWRSPLLLTMPAPWLWSITAGLLLFAGWLRLLVMPLLRRTRRNVKDTGLAANARIRRAYGARAVRKSGEFTLPGSSSWRRLLLADRGFGYTIGKPVRPKDSGALWINWEQRLRIVARSGWGKTMRLLVPIIRQLPGPAVISSIEPEIFMSTVLARRNRRRPARWAVLRLLPAFRRVARYPVFVVDFSSPETRFAAGWPRIRWNPIPGCENFIIATRRAHALIHASDADPSSNSETDAFFRTSATQVLAAWFHAAALAGDTELTDLLTWLRDGDTNTPQALLKQARSEADPTALMNMLKHLDPKAGRTTSGVERYLTFALSSLCSGEGRALCGSVADGQFSMEKLIQAQGTVYLLAEPDRMALARPVLSLIAEELFLAAERVARQRPGRSKRLPQPFIGVLDELRYGVRVANLPYVANTLRKFGISYIYAVQTAAQEESLYGRDGAAELRSAAATTVYGGIDPASARDVADRAGQVAVVQATRGANAQQWSEQLQMRDVFTIADQQQLADGESVIVGRGLAPFVAYTPLVFEQRKLRRRISSEVDTVNTAVVRARADMIAEAQYQKVMGSNDYQPGAQL